jgi:hypothetical protein
MRQLINAFNAGEFTPELLGRVDLESLRKACRLCRNFLPRTLGGVRRRPGLMREGSARFSNQKARLVPFNFSTSARFMLELGDGYIRFWRNGLLVLDGAGAVVELAAPWREADLFGTQTVQVNDLVFLTHPAFPVTELRRLTDVSWTLRGLHDPVGAISAGAAAWAIGAPGTAVILTWLPPNQSISTVLLAENFISANTPAIISDPGYPAPVGTGNFFVASIQRMQAFFTVPASGVYEFRARDIDDLCRLRFNPIAGLSDLTAEDLIVLQDTIPGGLTSISRTIPLLAGGDHWIEFLLVDWTRPSGGAFEYRVDGGPWTAVTADLLKKASPPAFVGESPVRGWPAMRDVNDTAATMACSVTSGAGILTCSSAQFTAGDVGAYYQISHRRETAQVEKLLNGTGPTAALRVLGSWEVFTFGTWAGALYLETQGADGAWTVLRSWVVNSDQNIQANGKRDRETIMRLRFSHGGSSGSVPPRALLAAIDPEINGLVRVNSVISPTVAGVSVVRALHSTTPTAIWAEGAWSIKRGFPRACALHQQRLVLAGCAAEPQKVWGSAINDFNNFQYLDFEDAAYAVLVAAQEANPIVWLASQEGLIVGTEGDEWLMDSGDAVISPTNPPNSKRKTKFGSADMQAQLVGSVVLFIQRGGRAMREYVFAFDEQGYKAPDLTQLSDHMTRSGITQFCFAQNPDSTIWAVTADGRLLSCTYRRESEVVAWAQHPIDGAVESVATIYGATDADEIWCIVRRTIGGVTSRHVERFDPAHWDLMAEGEAGRARLVFFDCAKRITLPLSGTAVGGLGHLEGAIVSVRADGAAQPSRKVTGGSITLDSPATTIIVGLPYYSRLQPFLFDTQLQDGTSQGMQQRTPELRLRLHESGAAETADSPEAEFYPLSFRVPMEHNLDAAPPLFSGLTEPLHHQSAFQDGTNFEIRTNSGEPLNILMVVAQTGIYVR